MASPLRLGLVGAGRWGKNFITTLSAVDGVRLTRLASRNLESLSLIPDGCEMFPDWQELIVDREIDGLIIASPPHSHAEIATAACSAGLPVLVEKPLTTIPSEAHGLLTSAEKHGDFIMVDHIHLFHPAYRALKAKVSDLGGPLKITKIVGEAGNNGPVRDDVSVLWDWGPHDVSMMLDLMDEYPTGIQAERIAEGTIGLALDFVDGRRAETRLCNRLEHKVRRLDVFCAGHRLTYDDTGGDAFILDEEPIAVSNKLPLTQAIEDFAQAIRENATDLTSLRLGVDAVDVLTVCDGTLKTN